MTIKEIQKQYANKNIRWVVWKAFYKDKPTIHFIDWIDEKWDKFLILKFGKIYDYFPVSEKLEQEFDNWLISLL